MLAIVLVLKEFRFERDQEQERCSHVALSTCRAWHAVSAQLPRQSEAATALQRCAAKKRDQE
jgi:hypothetical protein